MRLDPRHLLENYAALHVAIEQQVPAEMAFDKVYGHQPRTSAPPEYDQQMLALRAAGFTNAEIGREYGLSEWTICRRLSRHTKALKTAQ